MCAVLLLRVRLGEARARVNELSLSPSTSSKFLLLYVIMYSVCDVCCLLFLCLTAPLLNAIINSIFRERDGGGSSAGK